jgi:hypothetical protein
VAYFRVVLGLFVTVVVALGVVVGLGRQDMRASGAEVVSLASGSVIGLATPPFIQRGKRYSFSWPGGGPPQTFTVKDVRSDGWVLAEVADENIDPVYAPPGSLPTRWLNAALATSIQEMRPLPY